MAESALYKKLSAVMAEVERIPKNGWNSFHKYKYAQEADVSEHLRKAFATQGLFVLPSCLKQEIVTQAGKDGDSNYLTIIDMEMTIVDTETGESVTVKWAGQGQDKGDKGLYKAFTGAVKYFLMKTFLIPTGDDPEEDERPENGRKNVKQAAQANAPVALCDSKKARMLYAAAHGKGFSEEEVKTLLNASYGVDSALKLPTDKADKLLVAFQKTPAEQLRKRYEEAIAEKAGATA